MLQPRGPLNAPELVTKKSGPFWEELHVPSKICQKGKRFGGTRKIWGFKRVSVLKLTENKVKTVCQKSPQLTLPRIF